MAKYANTQHAGTLPRAETTIFGSHTQDRYGHGTFIAPRLVEIGTLAACGQSARNGGTRMAASGHSRDTRPICVHALPSQSIEQSSHDYPPGYERREASSPPEFPSAHDLWPEPSLSLTADWEILPPSFGLVTRFGHINIRDTFSCSKYVFPFRSVTLRSHQFVVKPRRDGSSPRQRERVGDFQPLVFECLRDLRCRRESSFCLFAILRLLKRQFRTMWRDFRSDVFGA